MLREGKLVCRACLGWPEEIALESAQHDIKQALETSS
jgi:hypothetical protein